MAVFLQNESDQWISLNSHFDSMKFSAFEVLHFNSLKEACGNSIRQACVGTQRSLGFSVELIFGMEGQCIAVWSESGFCVIQVA